MATVYYRTAGLAGDGMWYVAIVIVIIHTWIGIYTVTTSITTTGPTSIYINLGDMHCTAKSVYDGIKCGKDRRIQKYIQV